MRKALIYLVEDDEDLRASYQVLLSSFGNVLGFGDATEFLNLLEMTHNSKLPDLVITDLSMPGMCGVEMMSRVAKAGLKIPTILLSGMVDKDSAIEAMNSGFCLILEKPVSAKDLKGTVRDVLLASQVEKIRHEMIVTIKQIRELTSAFRETYSNELELKLAQDPDTVVDASGNDQVTSLSSALEEIEGRLSTLIAEEVSTLEEMSNMKRSKLMDFFFKPKVG